MKVFQTPGWIPLARVVAAALVVTCATSEATAQLYDPDRSLFSRFAEAELPAAPESPSAEELAASLDLEPAGEEGGIPQYQLKDTSLLFVFVPGGTFTLGSHYSDIYQTPFVTDSAKSSKTLQNYFVAEQPAREVYLSPYFISKYEITVKQYRKFVKAWREDDTIEEHHYPGTPAGFSHVPFLWKSSLPFWEDDSPIIGISWYSAYAFCQWRGGRLPTEAEWEKAARGTDRRIFPWGNVFDPMRANTRHGYNGRTMEVGSYQGGRSPLGCYDMAGNAAEYTLDAFEMTAYQNGALKDPCILETFPLSQFRVVRGGSWNEQGYLHRARTTSRERGHLVPNYQVANTAEAQIQYLQYGFRMVLTPQRDLLGDEGREQVEKMLEAGKRRTR